MTHFTLRMIVHNLCALVCDLGLLRHAGVLAGVFVDRQAFLLHVAFIVIDGGVLWSLMRKSSWGHNAAVLLFSQQVIFQIFSAFQYRDAPQNFSAPVAACCGVLLIGLLVVGRPPK